MCGIAAQYAFHSAVNADQFDLMLQSLNKRGPDHSGTMSCNDGRVMLGTRRLSIVDATEFGNQPFFDAESGICAIGNGYISNFRELRQRLVVSGHDFRSESDMEVLLHGYKTWGINLPKLLKGMFAFVIWDAPNKQLFIARDHFGIKPLYFTHTAESFSCASDCAALLQGRLVEKRLNLKQISNYLYYRYVPEPETIWKGIYKLEGGTAALIDEFTIRKFSYWTPGERNLPETADSLEELVIDGLTTSVKNNMIADQDPAIFLSAGMDSNFIHEVCKSSGYLSQTFTVGFENWNKSEHLAIQQHKIGFTHHERLIGSDALNGLDQVVKAYSEPIADLSILPTFEICKFASQKTKSVLSGEGGDELLCGYLHYLYILNDLRESESLGTSQDISKLYAKYMHMGEFNFGELSSAFGDQLIEEINPDLPFFYRQHVNSKAENIHQIQQLDLRCFLGQLLMTKVDRASMHHGLEVRVPFLDHELFDLILNHSSQAYFFEETQKPFLSNFLNRTNPQIETNRPKQGFIADWAFYADFSLYREQLLGGTLISQHMVNAHYIEQLLNNKDQLRLYKLLVLELWMREWT